MPGMLYFSTSVHNSFNALERRAALEKPWQERPEVTDESSLVIILYKVFFRSIFLCMKLAAFRLLKSFCVYTKQNTKSQGIRDITAWHTTVSTTSLCLRSEPCWLRCVIMHHRANVSPVSQPLSTLSTSASQPSSAARARPHDDWRETVDGSSSRRCRADHCEVYTVLSTTV